MFDLRLLSPTILSLALLVVLVVLVVVLVVLPAATAGLAAAAILTATTTSIMSSTSTMWCTRRAAPKPGAMTFSFSYCRPCQIHAARSRCDACQRVTLFCEIAESLCFISSDGLHPSRDGLHPSSDDLQPRSNDLQPTSLNVRSCVLFSRPLRPRWRRKESTTSLSIRSTCLKRTPQGHLDLLFQVELNGLYLFLATQNHSCLMCQS